MARLTASSWSISLSLVVILKQLGLREWLIFLSHLVLIVPVDLPRSSTKCFYEPVSRDQILRHARGQGNMIFPVQLTTSRIGNLTRLIHTLLYVMTIHTYIHTYIHTLIIVSFPRLASCHDMNIRHTPWQGDAVALHSAKACLRKSMPAQEHAYAKACLQATVLRPVCQYPGSESTFETVVTSVSVSQRQAADRARQTQKLFRCLDQFLSVVVTA